MTIFGPVIDARPLLPRERGALIDLLRALDPADWDRPTVCPGWAVHDVVGHILNDAMRRIAGGRDGHRGVAFADGEALPAYLARINDDFVRAMRQCSPRLMVDMLGDLGPRLDALWAGSDLTARADLDVSWAATDLPSPLWLDLAREYTEFWVHQQQIRDAVARPGADDPELLGPVVDTFLRALPSALQAESRPEGTAVRFEVTGAAGGVWTALRAADRWRVVRGEAAAEPAAHVRMDADSVWRLGSRGITVGQARQRASLHGDRALAEAATALLAVVR